MEKIVEWCPHCGQETEIDRLGGKCEHCGHFLKPCSLCNMDIVDCSKCEKDKTLQYMKKAIEKSK